MSAPYVSEVKFLGAGVEDFIEVALDAGADPSSIQIVVYNPNGSVRSINDLNSPDNTMAGKDVYSIEASNSASFDGVHKKGAIAVVENGNVAQFISFEKTITPNTGPAAGLTSTKIGGTNLGESMETRDGGGSYSVNTAPSKGTIPCFLEGTLIDTDQGQCPIEDIRPGMRVNTLNHGANPVLWAGKRQLTLDETASFKTRPIHIPANALGPGQPERSLVVSPNHRILINDAMCRHLFNCNEVFVAAKFLLNHNGIGHAPLALPVRVYHLLFESHEVICANGMNAESLFHGDIATKGFEHEKLELSRFPRHDRPARRVLKSREAARLLCEMTKQKSFHLKVS